MQSIILALPKQLSFVNNALHKVNFAHFVFTMYLQNEQLAEA